MFHEKQFFVFSKVWNNQKNKIRKWIIKRQWDWYSLGKISAIKAGLVACFMGTRWQTASEVYFVVMENSGWKSFREITVHKKINQKRTETIIKKHLQVLTIARREPQPRSCCDLLSRLCLCIDIGISTLLLKWKVLAKPTTVLRELCTLEVNYIMPD